MAGCVAMIAGRGRTLAQDQDAPGLTSASSWESPQFGNTVVWSGTWTTDDDNTMSDEGNLLDRLTIVDDNGTILVVMFIEAGEETAADYAGRLVRYRHVTDPDAAIAWNEGDRDAATLLYRSRVGRQDVVSIIDIRLSEDKGVLRVVEMVSYLSGAEAAFARVQAEVAIDEDTPYPGFEDFPGDRLD
jgi:hypothetical protein